MRRQSKSDASTAASTLPGEVTASIWYPSPLRSRRSDSSTSRWSSAIRILGALESGFISLAFVPGHWSFVLGHWSFVPLSLVLVLVPFLVDRSARRWQRANERRPRTSL